MILSPNFKLAEFIRMPPSEIPTGVIENLEALCKTILQPLREAVGLSVVIHSGYRPPEKNAAVGGVAMSDHQTGRAADFHVVEGGGQSWEQNTFDAYHWLRKHALINIGQLILEDHRIALKNSGKLWVHVATASARHPGKDDRNQLLVSYSPGSYNTYRDEMEAFG